MFVKFL